MKGIRLIIQHLISADYITEAVEWNLDSNEVVLHLENGMAVSVLNGVMKARGVGDLVPLEDALEAIEFETEELVTVDRDSPRRSDLNFVYGVDWG